MSIPYKTSTYLSAVRQTNVRFCLDPDAQYHTVNLPAGGRNAAPQGGLVNLPVQPLPIVQISVPFNSWHSQSIRSTSATIQLNFIDIPYHLSQNYVTFSKNIYLSSYPVVTQDTLRLVTNCKLHCGVRGVSFAGLSQHRSVLPDRNELRNPQRQLTSDR